MSLLHILPASISTPHQLQARDLLQSAIRWPDDDLSFLRAIITRRSLNERETEKLTKLREAAHG